MSIETLEWWKVRSGSSVPFLLDKSSPLFPSLSKVALLGLVRQCLNDRSNYFLLCPSYSQHLCMYSMIFLRHFCYHHYCNDPNYTTSIFFASLAVKDQSLFFSLSISPTFAAEVITPPSPNRPRFFEQKRTWRKQTLEKEWKIRGNTAAPIEQYGNE